ncbi:potassium-transporting ATPase subunit KdpB [Gemmatimonas groenlandica]|uniref:Potassium-transporting ATPase ATP-binding subunit n=1 Tax=Gemmatimonas groenlandica TaxID=2732249 RepID=A0A6M4IQN7_9BACT|nr:potassium-transporting ATPase subunit KdpB [Gemmatimonas groenlandica]QJR36308.1 potassium-transporting ATPase subunit KdpB [Gemmatimonas groenlandica]
MVSTQSRPLFDPPIVRRAVRDAFVKLNPKHMVRNPVMFVVLLGSAYTTAALARDIAAGRDGIAFTLQLTLWLWFTVLFANFAEAMAEGRGKAQADTLRESRTQISAKKLDASGTERAYNVAEFENVSAATLRRGDLVVCVPGDVIPGDGEVVEGVASVDESAITGESAPVIRESGGDRSAITGGTKVLSDFIVVRITANPGETFIDRMIALVEGASRQKTPNEIALTILLSGLTIIFVLAVATLQPFAIYAGSPVAITVLIALLVCLIPTTIGGLLSAIGIAGMDRMIQQNVIAMSGRAVEAAGDVNTLLLDKTGTITLGNRQASEFVAVGGTAVADLADRAQLASLADETPEGRSIVVLAKSQYGLRGREVGGDATSAAMEFVPFSASTRMSGVNLDGRETRKGAGDAVIRWTREHGGTVPADLEPTIQRVAREGGTPLVVAERDNGIARILGVIYLKDVVKGGMKERFDRLRAMGIRTVMITGDNPLTAAAIAQEAGVDDFLAEAKPEDKMALIKREQAGGKLVAMTGDGTNDAPALAQADVGVAMNSGTQAAKEAGNMIDLDSNPTKLIEIVEIGKQLLMTRGSLTTFSIANDVAKYFAIIPAIFISVYGVRGALQPLNVMRLHSPESAILASVIFNALIIVALIPLALRGVKYRPAAAGAILRRNLLVYGVGGLIVPFVGIKAIDVLLVLLRLV